MKHYLISITLNLTILLLLIYNSFYILFSKWQKELAKDGVIVELDNNGNWYNVG